MRFFKNSCLALKTTDNRTTCRPSFPYLIYVQSILLPMAQDFNAFGYKISCMKKLILSLWLALCSVVVLAQEGETKNIDINISTDDGAWYTAPWVWVVGAAVFILLLVALTRGGSRRAD